MVGWKAKARSGVRVLAIVDGKFTIRGGCVHVNKEESGLGDFRESQDRAKDVHLANIEDKAVHQLVLGSILGSGTKSSEGSGPVSPKKSFRR